MGTLAIWTLYQNPRDYPGRFVVRRGEVTAGGFVHDLKPALVIKENNVRTLAQIFEWMSQNPNLHWMGRQLGDDFAIVGVWI